MWNRLENGEVHYDLYDSTGKRVGNSHVRLTSGQMCSTRLDEEYRGCKMGYDLVALMTNDKFDFDGTTELFVVTIKNHPFWSKLPNSEFLQPAGPRVTGSGFRFDLGISAIFHTNSITETNTWSNVKSDTC